MDSKKLFYETLESFYNDLNTVFPEFSDELKSFKIENYKINDYYIFCNEHSKDISIKNEIIFSKELKFMDPIPFNKLWTQSISETSRNNFWKYIQNMYLYSYCHQKDENVLDMLLLSKKPDINWSQLDEEKTKIIAMFYKVKEDDNVKLDDEAGGKSSEGIDEQFLPKIGNLDLFDTKIGSLAKEISEEINLDNIDPEKLLSGLNGGNMDIEGSGIMNLIGTIGDKVKNKIDGGSLDQDNLVNEANNIMGEFGKMGGDNPLNMLNNLFKGGKMGGIPGMPDLANMAKDMERELTAKEKKNAKKKAKKKEKKVKTKNNDNDSPDNILNDALDELSKK
tara:strand:- start:6240 stop:7247 length:1008 start_codon:yes stop_codon:yes gene_type:complete